jgi:hypothetical protein
MYRLVHSVGSVQVDSITMTVDWFVFFLCCAMICPYRLESQSGLTVQTRRDLTDVSKSCVLHFSDVPIVMANVIRLVKIRDIMNGPKSA